WDSGEATTIWTDSAAHDNPDADVYFERVVPEVVGDSWCVFTAPSSRRVYWIEQVAERSLADFALTGRATGLTLRDPAGGSPTKDGKLIRRTTTAFVESDSLELAELPIEDDLVAGQTSLQLDELAYLDLRRPVPLPV